MEVGINSFIALHPDPSTGAPSRAVDRIAAVLSEIRLADEVGIDVFGIGEHHRPDYADSSPAVILAAAAALTSKIRLTSAVSVLSTVDPVRLFQDFAALDLLSNGRAEITVGRGSFAEAYPLFGYALDDYDALFSEKLNLLLALRGEAKVTWSGRFRPPLSGQGVYPRPIQPRLPVWVGVGGTPQSAARAGAAGLPLMIAAIGGEIARFGPLIELYRRAGLNAGHTLEDLKVGLHVTGFLADSMAAAKEAFYPGWSKAFTAIGKERGWSPVTQGQFDAACGPSGPFLVGDPETVIRKATAMSQILGGVDRISFQMSAANTAPQVMSRSIELIGRHVAPALRELAATTSGTH